MKNIDIKSLIIGVLLATTIIFGMGATGVGDKWDDKQEWAVAEFGTQDMESGKHKGYEALSLEKITSKLGGEWHPNVIRRIIREARKRESMLISEGVGA